MKLLVFSSGSLAFLVFFRFDWLGLFSAALGSLARPMSLKKDRRSLDQHILMFFLMACLPVMALRFFPGSEEWFSGSFSHPGVSGILCWVLAALLFLSSRWNKRIHGLNHIKTAHAVFLAGLLVFSLHPTIPSIGLLWIGLAFCNYHYEALFKYSMLIHGLNLFSLTAIQLGRLGFKDAFDQIGVLNSVAVVLIALTVFWIGLENLQKTIQEGTLRSFVWLNAASGIFFFVILFLTQS